MNARIVYQDTDATLYQGDALAVLSDLPDEHVDALITDPPYSSGGFTRADRAGGVHSKYVNSDSISGHQLAEFAGDNRDQRGHAHWLALWLAEAHRVTRSGGIVCLFTDWRQLPITTDAIQAGGYIWRGVVPWVKPSARPQAGRFTAQCEYVVWGTRGPMPVDPTAGTLPGFYQSSPPRDRDHITQKPLDVMRSIVKIVPRGGIVLDPFAGSGTTGAAALIEGRRFVGVELTDHFADVTARRLATVTRGHHEQVEQGVLDLETGASP